MKKILLFGAIAALSLLAGCSTLTRMASLMTCQYRLQGVADPRLAGIGLTSAQDLTKLDAATAIKVGTGLAAGNLPMSLTVNLGITNNNTVPAQLAGLEWALFFDETSMLTGQTDNQINVNPNGGTATVPFTVQADLAQLFKGQSREQMLRFANGLLHMGEQDSQVSLRIRPAVSFGGQVYKTGFITVSKSL